MLIGFFFDAVKTGRKLMSSKKNLFSLMVSELSAHG